VSRKACGNTEGEAVLCPLFKSFTANTIRCESHVPDSETVELRYSDTKKCAMQRKIFCEGVWKRCEHYQSWVHMKWEDTE